MFLPSRDLFAEATFGERKRGLSLRFGLGFDQVGQPFGFGKVDPSVLEGAPRKFTRLCQAKALDSLQHGEDGVDHRTTAMALKFNAIFTRRARGSVKPENQRLIEQLAGTGVAELSPRRRSRLRQKPRDQAPRLMRPWPAHANDRDRGRRAPAR